MAHKVMRLSKEILSKPQLLTQEKFEEIAEYLEKRNSIEDFKLESFSKEREEDGVLYEGNAETGVIKIYGPLTYREPAGISALCGDVPSYESILRDCEKLCKEPQIKNIVLDIDSGGGQAYRCFSTARQLRKMADDNGKRLITYCDGMAASAAYALGCASHEFVINPDAEAGSIGVVIRLASDNRKNKQAGIDIKYVQAGASKTPFDEEGEYKADFIEGLQNRIDKMYNNFVKHVADMRGIDPEVVRGTEAKVFDAEEALELGLVDSIMEAEDFKKKYLVSDTETGYNSNTGSLEVAASDNLTEKKVEMNTMSTEKLDASMAAELETLKAELASLKQEKAEALLQDKKEGIRAELSNATFLSNVDEIVECLAVAEESQAALLSGVIADAVAELGTQAEKNEAALSKLENTHNEKLASLEEEKAALLASKEEVKAEFAKNEAIREEEDKSQLEELSHKEKLAKAVASKKAQQA